MIAAIARTTAHTLAGRTIQYLDSRLPAPLDSSIRKITTVSARQAQIKVVDVRYIVTDLDLSQTSGGGGGITTGTTGAGGAVGSTIQPIAEPIELGPVLDHHALMINSSLDMLAADWRSERIVSELERIDGLGAPAQRLDRIRAELVDQGLVHELV